MPATVIDLDSRRGYRLDPAEAAVLRDAEQDMLEWIKRLPEGSSWAGVFAVARLELLRLLDPSWRSDWTSFMELISDAT